MKLVDDIGDLWKRWSTRIAASQGALVVLFVSLPEKWQDAIPHTVLAIFAGLFALGIISAQAVKQPNLPKQDGA